MEDVNGMVSGLGELMQNPYIASCLDSRRGHNALECEPVDRLRTTERKQ